MTIRLLTFAFAMILYSRAHAVVKVFVEIPHDKPAARDEANKFPETAESRILLSLLESLALADRSIEENGLRFPYCYQNFSKAELEKRFGKPIEWKPSDYARPCTGDEIIFPQNVGPADVEGFMSRVKFYELKDVGGVLVFYSAQNEALSPAVVYLRTDDKFVPLRETEHLAKRLEWESSRLRKLKEWFRIPEDVVKAERGEFKIKRE